jgi:hypothetical protein
MMETTLGAFVCTPKTWGKERRINECDLVRVRLVAFAGF